MLSALVLSLLVRSETLPQVYAHYMPWYQAPPTSGSWGWHWTMNHFHPESLPEASKGGRKEIASHYYPLIGPYDSSDPDVLEFHALSMKMAGIDGAIIDWYGRDDVYDYASNHRNTELFIQALKRAHLKFGICYEDQTLPNLLKFDKVPARDTVAYGKRLLTWMSETWFKDPSYLLVEGKPALLVFGPQFYKGDQWPAMKGDLDLCVFGVNGPFNFSNGGFGWPWPPDGVTGIQKFYAQARKNGAFIGDAFPRFHDIYGEAKVHDSWGSLPDDEGKTLQRTFAWAQEAGSKVIQITTWNDWGEGTQIEPSVEFGYRDLEFLQSATGSRFKAPDLRLPLRLFKLRKQGSSKVKLDQASAKLASGDVSAARAILASLDQDHQD